MSVRKHALQNRSSSLPGVAADSVAAPVGGGGGRKGDGAERFATERLTLKPPGILIMLITDIYLLRMEPALFIDGSTEATIIATGSDGEVSGTTFSSASADFTTAEIDAANVVVIAGSEALEVDTRDDANSLTVSKPRPSATAVAIQPTAGTSLSYEVLTFANAIQVAEAWVLGGLGIDPNDPIATVDTTAIIDTEPIEHLIALRVIADVYALAAARQPTDASLSSLATVYRGKADAARHRTVAWIDCDGDGIPEATRRIDVITFSRA